MNFEHSDKVKDLLARVSKFMDDNIYPAEAVYAEQMQAFRDEGNPWQVVPIVEDLKKKARAEGLWNFFLPESSYGFGLTNLEYAPLAELMGRSGIASEVFNCSAPDTGNMEVIERYGNDEHKKLWLEPLLNGEIRSAFAMTEPNVASSDATNISSSIVDAGDHYVINGEKWWTSGAGDPRCKILVFMGVTNPDNPKHQRQSQILVPMDTPGIEILRMMNVFGSDDAPHGHGHLRFTDVKVPKENLLLGEGRGFEIAQGRLGPGRIHHCMRTIGVAERASGAGGQHVNKTDSAIRITHLPSGIVVECQEERSQHKNRARALGLIKAKLLKSEKDKQTAKQADTRKSLVGSGDRSERIRTYNFPQGRVTDHRINLTLYKLEQVVEGDLTLLIEPLTSEHQLEQMARLSDE